MEKQKNIERVAGKKVGICLTSGFFGFYHHTGVLAALSECGVQPKLITGTSAGALVASMYATGLNPDEIKTRLIGLKREEFWDVHWPLTKNGMGLLAGDKFRTELGLTLKVHSFEQCPTPLAVGVFNLNSGRVEHFSKGPLIEAVYASCALPYLFSPSRIDGNRYWDGGFAEKSPLIPFLNDPEIEVVIVSYIPRRKPKKSKLPMIGNILPTISSLFAYTPREERLERDQASVKALREAGKEVIVLAPKRIPLGPYSMEKGPEAFDVAVEGTRAILDSTEDALGSTDLS